MVNWKVLYEILETLIFRAHTELTELSFVLQGLSLTATAQYQQLAPSQRVEAEKDVLKMVIFEAHAELTVFSLA